MKDPIYDNAGADASFASLDRAHEWSVDPTESGLAEWYASIANTPVAQLSDEDLARALRQNVHTPVTLRAALTMLERDPWAGYMFPSELARALEDVPPHVWREYPALRSRATAVISRLMRETPPEDLHKDSVEKLRAVLAIVSKTIAEASAKRVYLQVTNGPRVLQEDEDKLVIGSGPKAAVYVKELESEHAWVRRAANGGWEVAAIGGEVMLNGRVVTVAPLKPNDRLALGKVQLTFGEDA